MKEIKLAHAERAPANDLNDTTAPREEIRVLESFELVLAGGGDSEITWPH